MINLISSSLIVAVLSLFTPQHATYFIGGQVQDNAGKAVCGVRVCALAADFDPKKPNTVIPCALSDERGQFSIAVNKTGTYKLVYDGSAQGFQSTYLPFFRPPSVALPEVVVDDEHARSPITITMLPKNGLLTGKGVDAKTGLPVDNMEFMLCHATYPLKCWTVNSKNSYGYFSVPAPQVPFTFRIKAPGFNDWLGLNGDKDMPLNVAPETKAEFFVFLKRAEAAADKAVFVGAQPGRWRVDKDGREGFKSPWRRFVYRQ